ncbi:LuxR C-terminal-related transcriptional regulator [Streptomyces olivoreticuli]|uniref:LuxR C-terminal-related transcriptional regulator n=1 Tax=Streptomyces olivoreticuli TaxID=68246 RepID=UPI001F07CBD9|nr:LuxR C-terminal-related transcriptional regulator [Streptomyces olivoreticuli]
MSPHLKAAVDAVFRPVDLHHTCMAGLDATLTIRATDTDFLRQFGGTADELCGRHLYDLLEPGASEVLDRQFAGLSSGGHPRFTEQVVGYRQDRTPFSADITGIAIHSSHCPPDATTYLIAVFPADDPAPPPAKSLLSPVDARILEGIAKGTSNLQLAVQLYLSRQGVEYHVGRMLRQLKVPNRAALVARAHSLGMFGAGTWPPRVLPQFVKGTEQSARRCTDSGMVTF